MNEFLKKLLPPREWRIPVIILLGIFFGLGGYVLYISNAVSYLSDDPKTCVNCHIMTPQYANWKHSSHRENATCNDCHVPHDNVFNKYFFKAKDGMRHAAMFTMRMEPQVIKMHEPGQKVVQENCKRCHEDLNERVSTVKIDLDAQKHGEGKLCWECHREVPHGRVKSMSSTPDARAPLPQSPVPDWIKKATTK
ncbi:cytochrome c nitrite reductase small subunit [Aureibacter tunicatorum]|uniref:Cytochrome c nitrite reductase small subunit n=1 Tax=Aureibacter tunicatorum TaxID=866807 RepID=A0AAE4BQK5_9BACT|nr:cytochrome c nitrite reductase small subunit [Aureibacter tunicatorum]MDR6239229.1 cytochrome c nitrite reductase small subunit [Aureibacter tunicatorum]BDD04846.1 cytochrome c-type protein [Aureibacter tunicatorum]